MREVDTISATAAYVGVPVESLRKWRSAGTGPPVAKVGRHLRYRKAQVDRWLAEREREALSRGR
jgi:predicted site-specific integrase-resolvase